MYQQIKSLSCNSDSYVLHEKTSTTTCTQRPDFLVDLLDLFLHSIAEAHFMVEKTVLLSNYHLVLAFKVKFTDPFYESIYRITWNFAYYKQATQCGKCMHTR